MDFKLLIDKMTAEEKKVFEFGTASEYYKYVIEELGLKEKIKSVKEDNADFTYILEKLYLVVGKAVLEDEDYTFGDDVLMRLAKKLMNSKLTPEPVCNECYKFIHFLEAVKKGNDINEDLLDGHEIVSHSRNVRDLKILYSQHEEADLFRANQEYFEQLYENLPDGVVDVNIRSAVYAMDSAYDREKELVKRYEK